MQTFRAMIYYINEITSHRWETGIEKKPTGQIKNAASERIIMRKRQSSCAHRQIKFGFI